MSKARLFVIALTAVALVTGGFVQFAIGGLGCIGEHSDPTWMTNGAVWSIIRSGGYVYVGGQFTRVRELPPGVVGGASFAANGLAQFDAVWRGRPDVDPRHLVGSVRLDQKPIVYALAAAGDKIFVGGDFGAIDGQARTNFGAVDEATGGSTRV